MTVSREREVGPGPARSDVRRSEGGRAGWPSIAIVCVFFGLTILACPHFVEKIVSLDRRHGNMRPVVYGFQGVLGAFALWIIIARKRVNRWFYRTFPTTKELLIASVIVIVSAGFSVAAGEGIARLFHVPFQPQYTPSETALARFDPELGWSYIPNQSVTQEFGTDRRMVSMYFDDLGCRVRKPGDRADRAAPTALFVGGSYPFGHGLPYEDSFVGRLASMPDFPFSVVNLGVQAYGTDQSLLLLKRQFNKFNTKLVVYTFTSGEVIRNELYDRRIQQPHGVFVGTKPTFALRPDGSLYLAKPAIEFKNYSYSHLWAMFQMFELRYGPKPDVRLTRALIKDMRDFVESQGAKFVVLDWYDDKEFPWGLHVHVIRITASAPPEFDDWTIPGEAHPDSRAHLYVANLVAKELKDVVRDAGNPDAPASGVKTIESVTR
jgi:hypothetical protein